MEEWVEEWAGVLMAAVAWVGDLEEVEEEAVTCPAEVEEEEEAAVVVAVDAEAALAPRTDPVHESIFKGHWE